MAEIRKAILHYCEYQERCHKEVRNKLYELGLCKEDVEEELAHLISIGVVNEVRYAEAFARGKFRMKAWGREKIRQQLKIRGISDYCIRAAFDEIPETNYQAELYKLTRKKLNELSGAQHEMIRRNKAYRYLVSKGYEPAKVIVAIKEVMQEI